MAHLPKNLPKQQFRWIVRRCFLPTYQKAQWSMQIAACLETEKNMLFKETVAYRLQSVLKIRCFLKQPYCYNKNMCGNMQFLNSSFFRFSFPLFLSCLTILSNKFTPAK